MLCLNYFMTKELIIEQFVEREKLPEFYSQMAQKFILPLSKWSFEQSSNSSKPFILGINGSQGSGKSTLSKLLKELLSTSYNLNVAILSIDDFYLTREERLKMAENIHPLFETRGPPKTHDLNLAIKTIEELSSLTKEQQYSYPSFNKAVDDRAPEFKWPKISGPLDLIIFEGWLVGAEAQNQSKLNKPLNSLEAKEDEQLVWRTSVNDELKNYQQLWQCIDKLIFLKSPSTDAIIEWRKKQERKLAESSPGSFIMNEAEIERFFMFYERITLHCLSTLGDKADIVFTLGLDHVIESADYKGSN